MAQVEAAVSARLTPELKERLIEFLREIERERGLAWDALDGRQKQTLRDLLWELERLT